jgi:hypothetical protein
MAGVRPTQSGRVETSCPAECRIPITITLIRNILSEEGRKVRVDWRLSDIPSDLRVIKISVVANATLEGGAALDGTVSVSPSARSATVPIKGGFLSLNKGRSDDVKETKVIVSVISNLKEELGQPRNIKIRTAKDPVVSPNVPLLDNSVEVTWDLENRPCDTLTGFEVELFVNPRRIGSDDVVKKRSFSRTGRKMLIFVKGLGKRQDNPTITARVLATGRSPIICSVSNR